MKSAARMVDGQFRVEMRSADLGDSFQEIAILSEYKIFAKTADLLECASSHDDTFSASGTVVEHVVEHPVEEVVESKNQSVRRTRDVRMHELRARKSEKPRLVLESCERVGEKSLWIWYDRISIGKNEHIAS